MQRVEITINQTTELYLLTNLSAMIGHLRTVFAADLEHVVHLPYARVTAVRVTGLADNQSITVTCLVDTAVPTRTYEVRLDYVVTESDLDSLAAARTDPWSYFKVRPIESGDTDFAMSRDEETDLWSNGWTDAQMFTFIDTECGGLPNSKRLWTNNYDDILIQFIFNWTGPNIRYTAYNPFE